LTFSSHTSGRHHNVLASLSLALKAMKKAYNRKHTLFPPNHPHFLNIYLWVWKLSYVSVSLLKISQSSFPLDIYVFYLFRAKTWELASLPLLLNQLNVNMKHSCSGT
jgi:hypothetical protein